MNIIVAAWLLQSLIVEAQIRTNGPIIIISVSDKNTYDEQNVKYLSDTLIHYFLQYDSWLY